MIIFFTNVKKFFLIEVPVQHSGSRYIESEKTAGSKPADLTLNIKLAKPMLRIQLQLVKGLVSGYGSSSVS